MCPLDVHEHPVQPVYALLQRTRLLRDLSGLRGGLAPGLGLDHDVEVEEFLGQSGHVVLEAERVFADGVRGEDVVALAFALAVEEDLLVGILDVKVDVERASGLNLFRISRGGETEHKTHCSQQSRTAGEELSGGGNGEKEARRTPIFSPALSTSA